jgi:hypothetical protein
MAQELPYIEAARQELLNPTLELTKQHLAVLDIQTENGLPEVARVNLNHSNNIVAVYFKVKNERFFVVVNLDKQPKIEPLFTWVESGHRVYLMATSDNLNFQKLSSYLTLQPLIGWSKGDMRANGKSEHTFSRVAFEPDKNEAYDLEEKLMGLLTILEQNTEGVKKLTENADAYISVCRHQYISGNAGIHLDIATIIRLQKLNLGIDIDTYIVGTELKY